MMHIETHTFIEMLKKITKTRKALIIGSGGVGKTTLLNALEKHQLIAQNAEYKRTLFINFGTLSVIDGQGTKIKIQFQDLAGQLNLPIHALKDFSRQTLGATDIIFLVFATDNLQSFLELQKWTNLVNEGLLLLNINPNFVLIRNKIDLISYIDQNLVTDYLKVNTFINQYFETNCVNGTGLDKIISFLSKEVA